MSPEFTERLSRMKPQNSAASVPTSGNRDIRRRLRVGPPLAAALVAAGLALAACGGSSDEAPTILNTEKVERAIERSSLVQRGKRADVSCPSGVHQKKGLEFACTAVVKDNSTRFVVNQVDGAGNVHYEAR
ncbi:MAG: DUF4333 domain-containing protein [Solirubrobacteraceae bacterium]|nr:DUF4333 domain-containing protein [Solirubrobacteraceae bacterium]